MTRPGGSDAVDDVAVQSWLSFESRALHRIRSTGEVWVALAVWIDRAEDGMPRGSTDEGRGWSGGHSEPVLSLGRPSWVVSFEVWR